MKTAFNLEAHPRRPRPLLSEPPTGYFDQLPMQVMARLPRPEARENAGWAWWALLPKALRTSIVSTLLLGSFATSFWLSTSQSPALYQATASLDAVPQHELVNYLLTPETRVQTDDLLALPATADRHLANSFLHASPAELSSALDDQPADATAYF